MSKIVVVHGIGQQNEGALTLHSRLFPALKQGLAYGGSDISPEDASFPCYGHLFRPEAEVLSPSPPRYDAADVADGFEADLLHALWERAAETDGRVLPPSEEALFRTPVWAKRALAAMSRSAFLSGVAERAFIADLKQVSAYFSDPGVRRRALAEVRAAITPRTRVVIGHSLGSVVAYELLSTAVSDTEESSVAIPPVALVTLGSPLGLRRLVHDRLPRPGAWPDGAASWTNIADAADVVAVVEDLRPLYGGRITQIRVHNGARAHDMAPYLTDAATGRAIAEGLV